jgi:hypothetical protein
MGKPRSRTLDTAELRSREYARIKSARAAIDRASAEINDAMTRLQYLLDGDIKEAGE